MTTIAQLDLFNQAPPAAEQAPKLALPFQPAATIDIARVSSILNLDKRRVTLMVEAGLFRCFPKGSKTREYWQIEYDSVVAYCDRLRVHYAISHKRAPIGEGRRRRRDDELLPFPKEMTVSTREVMGVLDYSRSQVCDLIESGDLVAYQILIDTPGCPWRIYKPSLERYVASLHDIADGKRSRKSTHRTRRGR